MVHRIVDAGEIRRYARNLQGGGKVESRTSAATSSDVDTVSARKSPAHTNRYAIVIGIEQYRSHLPKADFANRDAVMMAQYLTNVMGYPEENVVVLLNENASLTDVMKYVEDWLPRKVKRDGSVFVYYSGHGAPNVTTKEAYILPYDGDPSFLKATGYSLNRLYEKLGQLPAKEIVVALDSCFSGAGGRSVVAEGARPVGLEIDGSLPSHKIAVLTASSGTQISSSYSAQGHGLFTYFLLKGLGSEGDVNRDGAVDLGELFNYVQAQVPAVARKHYNNDQTPQLIGPSEWGRKIRLVESAP
jgi:uncharacterized caspase-like protein